jgi:hypothetical protein
MSLVETETAARSALKALLDFEACISGASKSPLLQKFKGPPRLLVIVSYGNTRQARVNVAGTTCHRSTGLQE